MILIRSHINPWGVCKCIYLYIFYIYIYYIILYYILYYIIYYILYYIIYYILYIIYYMYILSRYIYIILSMDTNITDTTPSFHLNPPLIHLPRTYGRTAGGTRTWSCIGSCRWRCLENTRSKLSHGAFVSRKMQL
jgi:hypothetical protein